MFYKKIVLAVIFMLSMLEFTTAQDSYLTEVVNLNSNLITGYNYTFHSVNESKIIFAENFTNTIYIFDIAQDKYILEKKIDKGRGPGEANIINAATLIDNMLYLGVAPEFKIIQINIETGETKDYINKDISPRSFIGYNGKLLVENNFINNLFLVVDLPLSKQNYSTISFGQIDPLKEFESNFFKEGTLTLTGNSFVFSTQYKSHLYKFDLSSLRVNKKYEFDISTVSLPKSFNSGGGTVTLAPGDANIEVYGIGAISNNPDQILILAEGEGKNKVYNLDELNLYDLSKNEFIESYKVNITLDRILSDYKEGYIILYSENNNKVYLFNDE